PRSMPFRRCGVTMEAELRDAVDDPPSARDYNRIERAIYRWLAHPRLWPHRRREAAAAASSAAADSAGAPRG
ncbi:MAG TPA: hypothetical protein VH274_04600, partial [Mycobacteriales bacterium]|nr:hypothetical protein [Mycobacteriales bacterium]